MDTYEQDKAAYEARRNQVASIDRHPEHRRGINPRNERPGSVRRSY